MYKTGLEVSRIGFIAWLGNGSNVLAEESNKKLTFHLNKLQ